PTSRRRPRPQGRSASDDPPKECGVEVFIDGVSEQIECRVKYRFGTVADDGGHDVGVLEQAVNGGDEYVAVGPGARSDRWSGARYDAVADLVAVGGDAAQRLPRSGRWVECDVGGGRDLGGGHLGCQVDEAEAVGVAAFDAVRVGDAASGQHRAAADADDAGAGGTDRGVEVPGDHPVHVGGDVLGAGKDDEVGAVEVGGGGCPADVRGVSEQVPLVEVRCVRVAH